MQKAAFKKIRIFLEDYCRDLDDISLLSYKKGYAKFLKNYGLDENSFVAALLYDLDTGEKFGSDVSKLIASLKNFNELASKAGKRNKEEKIRKMLIATTQDLRVLIIKLLEMLYIMKNLDFTEDDKKIKISKDVLEIYVSIA